MDEELDEKHSATEMDAPGHRHSDRSPPWVLGTAEIDKPYDMNEYYDEEDSRVCLGDDASASVRFGGAFSHGKLRAVTFHSICKRRYHT